MLARRVLMAGIGGSFAPPPIWTFDLTDDGGMWSGKSAPSALLNGDYLYAGWVDGDTGDVMLGVWSLTTRALERTIVLAAALGGVSGNPDLHDSPALLVPATSHKLVVAYSAHSGAHPLVRISTSSLDTDPTLADGMDSEAEVGAAGDWTYMSLVQMGSGWCYLLGRSVVAGRAYIGWFYSSNECVSWSTPLSHLMATGANDSKGIYFRVAGDGGVQLHVLATDTDRSVGSPSSLYSFYIGFTGSNMDGAYQTDGTLIALFADFPIDVIDGTLLHGTADGPCDPEDLAITSAGVPCAVYNTWDSGGADITHWMSLYAVVGGTWSEHEIVNSGGLNNGNARQVGASIENADPYRILVPRKVGSVLELTRQVSADDGATWEETALTHGSTVDNVTPQAVMGGDARCGAVFAQGTYTDDATFDMALRGSRGG